MNTFFSRYEPQCYALMRMVAGFLFLWHGVQKLFDYPVPMPGGVPAFITSGEMAVAYWMAHGPKALLPIQNNGELAVLYCFVFLFIATRGSGIWSVDGLVKRR